MASLSKPRASLADGGTAAAHVMELQNAVYAKLRKIGLTAADGILEMVVDTLGYQVMAKSAKPLGMTC